MPNPTPMQAAMMRITRGRRTPRQVLENLLEWQFSHLWLGTVTDVAGNVDLTLVNNATAGNAATGVAAGNGITELQLSFPADGADDAATAAGASVHLDGTNTAIIGCLTTPDATNPGASRAICGDRDGAAGNTGFELVADTAGRLNGVVDGTTGVFDQVAGDIYDGTPRVFGFAVDETADSGNGEWCIAHDAGNGGVNSMPAGSTASTVTFSIGDGRLLASECGIALLGIVRGSQLDGITPAALQAKCLALRNVLVGA